MLCDEGLQLHSSDEASRGAMDTQGRGDGGVFVHQGNTTRGYKRIHADRVRARVSACTEGPLRVLSGQLGVLCLGERDGEVED